MTLPASGTLSLGEVNREINVTPSTTTISLLGTQTLSLAGLTTPPISISDLYSKYENWYATLYRGLEFIYYQTQTTDISGNVYFVAFNVSVSGYTYVKLNAAGVLQWQKLLPSPISSVSNLATDTIGNSFVISNTTATSNGICITKFDSAGNVTWSRGYQTAAVNPTMYPMYGGCSVDNFGSIYVSFTSNSAPPGSTLAAGYIKVFSDGTYAENRVAATGTNPNFLNTVYSSVSDGTSVNNIFFGGNYNDYSGGFVVRGSVWKMATATGAIAWQKFITPTSGNSNCVGVDRDSSGNIYAVGTAIPFSAYLYLAKLDGSGNMLWSREITKSSGNIEHPRVVVLPNGNICFGFVCNDGSGTNEAMGFIVFNSSGTVQFQRYVSSSPAQLVASSDFFVDLADAFNNIVAGTRNNPAAGGYQNIIANIPMVDNTLKVGSTTLNSNSYTLSTSRTGITVATGTLIVSNSSYTAHTYSYSGTTINTITPTSNTYVTAVQGIA
jgi:hypothetical protein